ncbi:MAG TPA: alkaline phosphatase family protein [Trebonia sp.]|jgi:phospholipase C|nr:alkaline phosphatase family protein [Trebonia sp.]
MGIGPVASGRRRRLRPYLAVAAAVALGAGAAAGATAASASTGAAKVSFGAYHTPSRVSPSLYRDNTKTPIKHLVVIFGENESFDHYFGTYPYAANTDGTPFTAKPGTSTVNGLYSKISKKSGPIGPLLTDNPNEYDPQRLTHSEALTSDQNHSYTPEQLAEDNGKMDMFVQETESSTPTNGCGVEYCPPGIVMDYFDGNTVTGLWNYAQYYSMSDNNWDTSFGPSTPGAINVTSGNTSGAEALNPAWDTTGAGQPTTSSSIIDVSSKSGLGTLYSDEDPYYDDCSDGNHATDGALAALTGQNIGDLLNTSRVSWGWFEGGFAPTGTSDAPGSTQALPVCGSAHANIGGASTADYVPHHEPFQYYASTANPAHLAPSSLAQIGYTDQANHQYDISDFSDALNGAGGAKLPAVSYLKAPAYQDAHPGYSDPLDEQTFLVNTINSIEQSKYWPSTAIVITYDDSDGWYDHQAPVIIDGSNAGTNATTTPPSAYDTALCTEVAVTVGTANGRCGYSQRLPMVVISPYTRENYVSSNLTDTASVVKFIEDNWLGGERIKGSFDQSSGSLDARGGLLDFNVVPHFKPVILNPTTGAVVSGGSWYGNKGRVKAKA